VAVEDMRARFTEWGIRVASSSPLIRAGARLREVADRCSYGQYEQELKSTGAAIRLVNDFMFIVSILGADRQDQMAHELRHALGGVLGRSDLSAKAQDVQAQYWFGAWLSHSALHPKVPARGRRPTPDYLIAVDTLEIAVEVKRIKSLGALARHVREAGSQLRRPRWPGLIAFDVTSCLDGLENPYPIDSDGVIRERLSESFSAVAADIEGHVSSLTGKEPFAGVVMLVSYARFMVWDPNPVLSPQLGFKFSSQRYPEACSSLVKDQTMKLERQLVSGVERMGGENITLRRVRP
jgi:hypothetical protein